MSSRERFGEVSVGEIEQILCFVVSDRGRFVFSDGHVGGADQREAFKVRDDEDDAAVTVLQNVMRAANRAREAR